MSLTDFPRRPFLSNTQYVVWQRLYFTRSATKAYLSSKRAESGMWHQNVTAIKESAS